MNTHKIPLCLTIAFVLSAVTVWGQNSTGINNTSPSAKAALDVQTASGSKQGILVPRLNKADTATLQISITTAEKGLLFFDIDNNYYRFWNGSKWVNVGSSTTPSGTGVANKVAYWNGTGTLSYNTNFHWDNTNARLGIGTAAPVSTLQIVPNGSYWDLYSTEGDFNIGNGTYRFKIGLATGGGGAGDVYLGAQGGTNRLFIGTGATSANFQTLTVTGGKVGIGTITPSYPVDVSGEINATTSNNGYGLSQRVTSPNVTLSTYIGNSYTASSIPGASIGTQTDHPFFIYVGNTGEKFYIGNSTQNYNVGIGTNSPASRLHVYTTTAIEPAGTGTTATGSIRISVGDSPLALDMGVADDAYSGAWLQSHYYTNQTTNTNLMLNPNGGNVYVGTTPYTSTPKLHIYSPSSAGIVEMLRLTGGTGTVGSGPAICFQNNYNNTTATSYQDWIGAAIGSPYGGSYQGDLTFYTNNGTVTTGSISGLERMRITSTGNVGIGTTTASSRLQIKSAGNTSSTVAMEVTNSSGTSLVYVRDDGRVGIGTNAPNVRSPIHIVASGGSDFVGKGITISMTDAYDPSVYFDRFNTTTQDWALQADAGGVFRISAGDATGTITFYHNFDVTAFYPNITSQNLTLGKTGNRWNTVYLTNNPNVSSDIRLKTNVQKLQLGLKEVLALSPIGYQLKNDKEKDTHLGFIAQDVRKIIPSIVKGEVTDSTYLSIIYSDLIPVLTNAIQEQQKIIDSIKTENKQQNLQLEQLKSSLREKDQQLKEHKSLLLKHEEELEKIKSHLGIEAKR